MKAIVIRIKGGKMEIDAQGFHGKECAEKLDELQRLLESKGLKLKVTRDENRPEYYETEKVKESISQ